MLYILVTDNAENTFAHRIYKSTKNRSLSIISVLEARTHL